MTCPVCQALAARLREIPQVVTALYADYPYDYEGQVAAMAEANAKAADDLARHAKSHGPPTLLSGAGLQRLMADLDKAAGIDMAPLSETVDCGECGHKIAFGSCCTRCHPDCKV